MKGDYNPDLPFFKSLPAKPDGSPYFRVEMEQLIRENLKSAMAKRNEAIKFYGLAQREGLSMKPVPLMHWLLDQMIARGEVYGDQIGIQPQDDFDPKTEAEFAQRLYAFVQAGQALQPKEGEMPIMSNFPPPPPVPGQAPPAYPPPPAPPAQGGWAPPPPPAATPQAQGPQFGPPPGYAPPQAPAAFAPPPAPPQQMTQQPQPGFAPPPPPPAAPQAAPEGAPTPAGGRGRRSSKATANVPPPPPPGVAPQQAAPQMAPPPPPAAPQFAPQGQPGFPPPAQFGGFTPPGVAPAPAPAPQPQGSVTDPTLVKVQQDVESLRAQVGALEERNRILETAIVFFLRGATNKPGENTAKAFLADWGVQVPSR